MAGYWMFCVVFVSIAPLLLLLVSLAVHEYLLKPLLGSLALSSILLFAFESCRGILPISFGLVVFFLVPLTGALMA